MRLETLERLRRLTEKDGRKLYERCLKAGEELGEICRAVMSTDCEQEKKYRSQAGGREAIVEESIDTLLVVFSILYDVNCSQEEIDQVLNRKMDKWQSIMEGKKSG